jgi:putative hydrolase of the HAD superfamily
MTMTFFPSPRNGIVLEKYGIAAEDIVYFGDNRIRDVQAAREEGILASPPHAQPEHRESYCHRSIQYLPPQYHISPTQYQTKQQSCLHDVSTLRVGSWAVVGKILVHRE